jgi:hypothetical protein
MRIIPGEADAAEFVTVVNQVVEGLLCQRAPESLVLVQIDNWFGPRWLHFAGKALGVIGVHSSTLTIPPFVPNRVLSQRKFSAPNYDEGNSGKPLHKTMKSATAMGRKAAEVAPGQILIWYSGNSDNIGRGSLMAYIPEGDSYRSWYAQWEHSKSWQLAQTKGVEPSELQQLMESNATGAIPSYPV